MLCTMYIYVVLPCFRRALSFHTLMGNSLGSAKQCQTITYLLDARNHAYDATSAVFAFLRYVRLDVQKLMQPMGIRSCA